MENYADLMFTKPVADLQRAEGSFDKYQRLYPHRTETELSEQARDFVAARDSFYIASVNQAGWPYIQHRGGARGFLREVSPNRLACADYKGNQQFISMGNLQTNHKVSLFFMDYLNHTRLKMQAKARLINAADADPEMLANLDTQAGLAERVLILDVVALDWNCPKYIPTLYSDDALRQVVGPQIAALQQENATLKAQLANLQESLK